MFDASLNSGETGLYSSPISHSIRDRNEVDGDTVIVNSCKGWEKGDLERSHFDSYGVRPGAAAAMAVRLKPSAETNRAAGVYKSRRGWRSCGAGVEVEKWGSHKGEMANSMGRILLGSLLRHSSRGCRTVSSAAAASSSQALSSARRLSSSAGNFRASSLSVLGYPHPSSRTGSRPFPSYLRRLLLSTKTSSSEDTEDLEEPLLPNKVEEDGELTVEWEEEEEEAEPKLGDGADGGGIVLQNVPWGEHALSIAQEVLSHYGDDMKLYAFKTTSRGYIYVRIDKMSNKYGCPSMEEIENFSQEYKKRLDEDGALGKIPDNLALEVSSPGAERLLKVPDDLYRFRDMPMNVCYVEDEEPHCQEKHGVFFLDSVETDSESCTWRLADVKENRDPHSKGRALSRKQKDWRLKLPYVMSRRVTLYLDF
ncbi:hypothetical protein BT93_G1734 [Corymbia citriodora subsp. variegata]|nr:hypothetical protein BT93_G1734 [Corymbia citriodora subsp. variegata]